MGSLNSIKFSCQCGNKTQEDSQLDCERKKDMQSIDNDLEMDNISMLLESTEGRNNIFVNKK
jgi:hypothetical protein